MSKAREPRAPRASRTERSDDCHFTPSARALALSALSRRDGGNFFACEGARAVLKRTSPGSMGARGAEEAARLFSSGTVAAKSPAKPAAKAPPAAKAAPKRAAAAEPPAAAAPKRAKPAAKAAQPAEEGGQLAARGTKDGGQRQEGDGRDTTSSTASHPADRGRVERVALGKKTKSWVIHIGAERGAELGRRCSQLINYLRKRYCRVRAGICTGRVLHMCRGKGRREREEGSIHRRSGRGEEGGGGKGVSYTCAAGVPTSSAIVPSRRPSRLLTCGAAARQLEHRGLDERRETRLLVLLVLRARSKYLSGAPSAAPSACRRRARSRARGSGARGHQTRQWSLPPP